MEIGDICYYVERKELDCVINAVTITDTTERTCTVQYNDSPKDLPMFAFIPIPLLHSTMLEAKKYATKHLNRIISEIQENITKINAL